MKNFLYLMKSLKLEPARVDIQNHKHPVLSCIAVIALLAGH